MPVARPKRLTDAHFPAPKQLSDSELVEVLEAHGFDDDQIKRMSLFLKTSINLLDSDMKSARRRKTRKADLNNLKASAKKIHDAIWHLQRCGFYGRQMARGSLAPLGEMFAVSWLREAFPDADSLPSREYPDAVGARTHPVREGPRFRGNPVYIEERTREARYHFARKQNLSLVSAALNEIKKSLDGTLQSGKKGREPCMFRHVFLINLALGWKGFGRDPHGQEQFGFRDFCEHIFESIEWPLVGIKRAIDKALTDHRAPALNHPKKRYQLRN
jgi:hypothetical protein